jgi:hypothetical protein
LRSHLFNEYFSPPFILAVSGLFMIPLIKGFLVSPEKGLKAKAFPVSSRPSAGAPSSGWAQSLQMS